jgi:hypothetical protein
MCAALIVPGSYDRFDASSLHEDAYNILSGMRSTFQVIMQIKRIYNITKSEKAPCQAVRRQFYTLLIPSFSNLLFTN